MNIDTINNHGANQVNDMEHITYGKPAFSGSGKITEKMGFSLDITGKVRENAAYGKEELKSAEEIAQMAGMTDVSLQRDYMAVMSNSMSDEDFAKLMEEGIDPTKIPAGETVTNLDRIKVTMAEAGQTIAGYNDDLSEDEIKAVLGNSLSAGRIISDTLTAADLPASPDNVSGVRQTLMMAQNLKPLSDEAKAYMIAEEMPPTVDNLYKAEYSAAGRAQSAGGVRFDGAATYAKSAYTENSWDDLKDQVEEVIIEAGLEVNEETENDAKWIAMHEIALTKETLKAYEEIKDLAVPAQPKDLFAAITVALEEGRSPEEADLTKTKSLYTKAAELVEAFRNMDDGGDLTKRRQLEEVRLVMTKEANLTLLRRGINIETKPLEELVDTLKEAERQFWAPLLSDDAGGLETKASEDTGLDEKIELYKRTIEVISEIPHIPVRVVAKRSSSDDFCLERIAEEGRTSIAAYQKAGQTYEALMTAPRADMGDSIRKAFRNVDDILQDLDMDVNEANRKAVRTLGYAGMMIDRDNIDSVRTATHSVERVISLMTPERTLSMIREGRNPLSENIFELERSLSEESFEEAGEKYSKFLFRLEKSGKITEDEKQTFIGMYRLFKAIEKQDGKVIGNVLSSGRDLTLKNMLEASRTNRHTNNEYVIDDDFGYLEKLVEKGDSITSQLERTFATLIAAEPDRDLVERKQQDVRAALRNSNEAREILDLMAEPVTVENILTVSALTGGMGGGFKKLFSQQRSFDEDKKEEAEGEVLTEEDAIKLTDSFDDRESAMSAYERFLDRAASVSAARTVSSVTYEDVRNYSMIYKQVGYAASLSNRESYEVPLHLDEGWTSIHLTIVHTKDEAGKVRATFESEEYGRVDATFSLKEKGVDGFIVSDSREGVDNLRRIDDKIRESLRSQNMDTANLSFVFSGNTGSERYLPDEETQDVSNSSLYRMAKAFIKAVSRA